MNSTQRKAYVVAVTLLSIGVAVESVANQSTEQAIPNELKRGYEHFVSNVKGKRLALHIGWQTAEDARGQHGRRVLAFEWKVPDEERSFLVIIAKQATKKAPQIGLNNALRKGVVPDIDRGGSNTFGRWRSFDFGVIGSVNSESVLNKVAKQMHG